MPSSPGPSKTLLVIRHGIISNAKAFATLEAHLRTKISPHHVNNVTYDWKAPILQTGIELAETVLTYLQSDSAIDRIIFVGHSQGGLVCRVAVAALCASADLENSIRKRQALDPGYFTSPLQHLGLLLQQHGALFQRAEKAVKSVVMLATPNAGAFTNGQLALQMTIAMKIAKTVVASLGVKNLAELTTDKLFTVLQEVHVRDVRYVSISGSSFNRYSATSWRQIGQLPVISRLAPALDLPNDTVVEDASVDLRQAPLPPEIHDLATQYTHVRAYTECVRISHTSIHSDQNAYNALDQVPGWW